MWFIFGVETQLLGLGIERSLGWDSLVWFRKGSGLLSKKLKVTEVRFNFFSCSCSNTARAQVVKVDDALKFCFAVSKWWPAWWQDCCTLPNDLEVYKGKKIRHCCSACSLAAEEVPAPNRCLYKNSELVRQKAEQDGTGLVCQLNMCTKHNHEIKSI